MKNIKPKSNEPYTFNFLEESNIQVDLNFDYDFIKSKLTYHKAILLKHQDYAE